MGTLNLNPEMGGDDKEVKEAVDETVEDETSADSSTEEKTDDESDSIENETSEKTTEQSEETEEIVEDKEVIGKRQEIEKLNKQIVELREQRRAERLGKTDEPLFVRKEELSDELKDIAPEDINLIKKVLKAEGYVKSDELNAKTYNDKLNTYLNGWLDEHPEYKPKNDPDDKNWNALQEGLKEFKEPINPKDIIKQLDKVHIFIKPKTSLPTGSRAIVSAGREKVNVASKTSGGGSKVQASKSKIAGREYLKGFDDDELDEIGV